MMKVQHGAGHFAGPHFSHAGNHACHFAAETADEGMLTHSVELESVANEGLRHRPIEPLLARTCQQIDIVHRCRVVLAEPGTERTKTTVEALGAAAAVCMKSRRPMNIAAAYSVPGQVGVA
jgi:hypothetical protein